MEEPCHTLRARGRVYFERGLYHAALETLWNALNARDAKPSDGPALHDDIGKTLVMLGRYDSALRHFSHAVLAEADPASSTVFSVHAALTYRRLSEHDRAQRLLSDLAERGTALPPDVRALVHGNLALVQAHNEFHREALANSLLSLGLLHEAGILDRDPDLHTNIGLHYRELGDLETAERHLTEACAGSNYTYLPPLAELMRLHMMRGAIDSSCALAQRTFALVWTSLMNFEKVEIALLCQCLADLAHSAGEEGAARRLIQKALILFGQMRNWREWQQTQATLDAWTKEDYRADHPLAGFEHASSLTQFAASLDAVSAQELVDPRFAFLVDTRVACAQKMADVAGLSADERQSLALACRFADYGLAVIEPDVALDPSRSPAAFERYSRHPLLSEQMSRDLGLPAPVCGAIAAHHERFDGSGFPSGMSGPDIPRLASLLAIADTYTAMLVLDEQPHSAAFDAVRAGAGSQFAPESVAVFEAAFETAGTA